MSSTPRGKEVEDLRMVASGKDEGRTPRGWDTDRSIPRGEEGWDHRTAASGKERCCNPRAPRTAFSGSGGSGFLHGGLTQAMLQIFGGHTGQHCPGGGGSGLSQGGLMQAMLQITDERDADRSGHRVETT